MKRLIRNAVRYTFNTGGYRTRVRAAKARLRECERAERAHFDTNYPVGITNEGDLWRSSNDEVLSGLRGNIEKAKVELERVKKE